MDGNSLTDDEPPLLDKLGTLREKVEHIRKRLGESTWQRPALDSLDLAVEQVNLAGQFIRKLTGDLMRFRREHDEWRALGESLFEWSGCALFLTDRTLRIRRANEAAAALLDVSPNRLEDEPLTNLFDGDRLPDLSATLRDTGDRFEFETSLGDRLGEIGGLDIRVELVPLAGEHDPEAAERLLWRIRDPADIDTVDTRLQQLQQDATLGRMASGITHEFKNILGIISTWTQLGLRDEDCSDSVRTALRKISHAANRGSTLTDSLLSYGQKNDVNPTDLDVNRLLRNNAETFEALLPGRIGVELELEESPLYVHFDENHFEQILLNLVLNARDAIEENGTITCRSQVRSLADESPDRERLDLAEGEYLEIQVEDTGCGMDDETLEAATAPFYSTKQQDGGTGLGLPTVHKLVARGGGDLVIDSAPREGTTVRVYLPKADV